MSRFPSAAALSARIIKAGADTRGERVLRLELLEKVLRPVGFDSYAWLLTDPATSVGVSPLADVPCLDRLPELIRLKYLTRLNRWTSLDGAVASLHRTTGGQLPESLLWREMLCDYQVVDVASMVFADRFGCWGFVDLWRTGDAAPFGDDELEYLQGVAAPLTESLRKTQARSFQPRPADARGRLGPVVLLLGPDLRVLGQTGEVQTYLRRLIPPTGQNPPIPASAYNVGAQLLAGESGADDNPPTARVHLVNGLWLTLRAGRVSGEGSSLSPNIAVTIEETSPAERLDVFARAFAFSPREAELLNYLAGGSTTRALAKRLFVSENTVQDHLKSVFAKTASNSRAALLGLALGV